MARRLPIFILLFIAALHSVGGSAHAAAQQGTPPSFTVEAYQNELARWSTEVEALKQHPQKAEELRQALPEFWLVSDSGSQIRVSNEFLRAGLKEFQKSIPERKQQLLLLLAVRLRDMRSQASGFHRPMENGAAMHRRLDQILATREFRRLEGPSLLEVWRDRLLAKISEWFGRLGRKLPEAPALGRIFVWLVLALATSALGVWLYRLSRSVPPESPRSVVPFAASAKSWRAWLAEAKQEATHGNWRGAIHFAYWAAVSRLESMDMWAPDCTRTPRDYLRALPGSSPYRAAFGGLTRRFEAVWYGNRPAGSGEFNEMLAQLEQLGCH